MQITLNLPDSLSQTETFNQKDWLREIAVALFEQERVSLSRASTIAAMDEQRVQAYLSLIQELLACPGEVSGGDRESD